jgi:hypothetical protein
MKVKKLQKKCPLLEGVPKGLGRFFLYLHNANAEYIAMKNIQFPIVIIKENDSNIYYINQNTFGLVSKGGESFYKGSTIYDSEGNTFTINGIKSIERASILNSIKYFQPMYLVKLNIAESNSLLLNEFKNTIIGHLQKYQAKWKMRDNINALEASVMSKNSFTEIIEFLK